MTSEGFNRLASLFLNDIDKITYTQDKEKKEKKLFNSLIKDNKVTLYFKIDRAEIGTFDNFKLIGKSGIAYTSKILNFTKANDEIIIEFPFQFIEGGEVE
ncbi:hypothetical protein FDF74_12645 [Clostridium niameyense]|uniref:Uncharacterized protein n=1 Tax=Clostridium niameyense TaxID=1622073 RepID=A0A6M0REB3_9CLOT|nr:hypothetical protein [Clostridium niameyense]NEZ48019.1 hypothetical protein [Clostridium niameyense]